MSYPYLSSLAGRSDFYDSNPPSKGNFMIDGITWPRVWPCPWCRHSTLHGGQAQNNLMNVSNRWRVGWAHELDQRCRPSAGVRQDVLADGYPKYLITRGDWRIDGISHRWDTQMVKMGYPIFIGYPNGGFLSMRVPPNHPNESFLLINQPFRGYSLLINSQMVLTGYPNGYDRDMPLVMTSQWISQWPGWFSWSWWL